MPSNGKVEKVRDLISDFKYPKDRISVDNGLVTAKVRVQPFGYKVLCFGLTVQMRCETIPTSESR